MEVYLEPLNRYEDHLVNTLADAASLRAACRAVHHVQLGDTDRLEPGHSHDDWPATMDALDDVGYSGWLAMECGLSGPSEQVLPEV